MREAKEIAANQNARAKRLGVEGTFTAEEWLALCEGYGNICLRCGERGGLSPDHVIALACGGTNYIHNIQPLCTQCNLKKSMNVDYRHETEQKRKRRWEYIKELRAKTQGKGHSLTFSVCIWGHLHDEISIYLISQGIEPTRANIQHLVYPWLTHHLEEKVRNLPSD